MVSDIFLCSPLPYLPVEMIEFDSYFWACEVGECFCRLFQPNPYVGNGGFFFQPSFVGVFLELVLQSLILELFKVVFFYLFLPWDSSPFNHPLGTDVLKVPGILSQSRKSKL